MTTNGTTAAAVKKQIQKRHEQEYRNKWKQEYRKRSKRIQYKSESENVDEDFDYVDSNDSDEQKYSSRKEEEVGKIETSHNSLKKRPKKLRIKNRGQ